MLTPKSLKEYSIYMAKLFCKIEIVFFIKYVHLLNEILIIHALIVTWSPFIRIIILHKLYYVQEKCKMIVQMGALASQFLENNDLYKSCFSMNWIETQLTISKFDGFLLVISPLRT